MNRYSLKKKPSCVSPGRQLPASLLRTLNKGEFDTFADYFFDGLIFDWIVQSKIDRSLERTIAARDACSRAVATLEDLSVDTQNRLGALQAQRAQIIEQA
jgi:hypothetical protein